MKQLYLFLLLFFIITLSFFCSKSGSSRGSESTVKYEVIVSNGTWSGDYFDDSNGSMQLKFVNNQPSGWKYSFSVPKGKHVGLVLSAIPDNGETVTANIYVNGSIVATDSSPNGATAQSTLN